MSGRQVAIALRCDNGRRPAEKPLVAVRAKVAIAGQEKEMNVPSGCKAVKMELSLPAGPTELWTYLVNERGRAGGAYFTDVEFVPDSESPLEPEVIPLSVVAEKTTSTPATYRIGTGTAVSFNAELDTLKNPDRFREVDAGRTDVEGRKQPLRYRLSSPRHHVVEC